MRQKTSSHLGFTALTALATFCNARASTVEMAAEAHKPNVAAAWDEVGVTDTLCAGSGGGDPGNLRSAA